MEEGNTQNKQRSGRPRKLDDSKQEELVQNSKDNCRKPLKELGNSMEPWICTSTVRTILHEEGVHRRKARQVIDLTQGHKDARLNHAWELFLFEVEDYNDIVWSDESYVIYGGSPGALLPRHLMNCPHTLLWIFI